MPRPSGISVKAIGLTAAGLLTLVFTIIIWVSVANTTAPAPYNPDFFPDDSSEVPNVEETQTGGAMLVTMVDKQDPTRVAATLKADRFEPIGDGKRRLDNPESWIYLKDGKVVKITADHAVMLMPDPNEPPESGTLQGNIHIDAYQSATQLDHPILSAQFDEPVEFERRYLRLRSPGRFNISSDQFDFAGTDLTVILNELRNRIELIDVAQGDQLVIHTNNQPTNSPNNTPKSTANNNPPSSADQSTTPAQPQATPTDTIADLLNHYHISLSEKVVASFNRPTGPSGTATADRLELWATLEGSTLAPDAITPLNFASTTPTSSSSTSPKPNTPASTQPATTPQASNAPSNIVITWTGKLTVRPIDDKLPPEFTNDKLTLKLSANPDAGITLSVPDQGFVGQAYSATYNATQARIELTSKQTQPGIIELKADHAGSLLATNLTADFTTGQISLDDRGQITSTPKGPSDQDSQSTIQWIKNASFKLAVQNNALTDRLTNAHFQGTVIAKQAGNSVGALSLDATLDPTLPPAQSLTKLIMTKGVLSSANRSMLTGTIVEINFKPSTNANTVEPIRLTADGQVFARDTQSMLKAEHLQATMYRDLKGDIAIKAANAQDNIQYTGVDRSTAQGNTLDIDAPNETMVLQGTPAKVAQAGSSIVGEHITLNAKQRGIEVLGPGSFDHDILLDNPSQTITRPTGHIRATWKGSMRFDDALGTIICQDQVRIISTPDAYTRDTLDAHRAEIRLSPIPAADPIANTPNTPATQSRELLIAKIFGHAPTGKDPVPAKVESRTYDQTDPERVIGLIYLEGPQIIADNQAQTLAVPAAGTLLIMDRSEDDDQANEQTADSSTNPEPGLTKFQWQGSMNLDRAEGTASFNKQVLVRQKTISTGKVASLSTDQLNARFEIGRQITETNTTDTPAQPTRLLGVDALGSVRFLYEDRELIADSAIYDALTDSLFASAINNKLVTLYDNTKPAPMSAKTMRWNLKQDRIEINAPTPTRTHTGG